MVPLFSLGLPSHLAPASTRQPAASKVFNVNYTVWIRTGFHKSGVLFNLHRAAACGEDRVVVVEGFFDCMKLHQAGQSGVVALMGCSLAGDQERLLTQRFSHIAIMLDADAAGWSASRMIAGRLTKHGVVEIVPLPAGCQPDQLSSEEICRALSTAARRERASSKV